MSTHTRRHCQSVFLCLMTLIVVSACSGKKVTTAVGDQEFQPGPSPAPSVEGAKATPPPESSPATAPEASAPEPSGAAPETPSMAPETPTSPAQETPATQPPAALQEPRAEAPVSEPQVEPPPAEPRVEDLRAEAPVIAPTPEPKPALPPEEPVAELSDVFFDFDQAAIRNDAQSALEGNARVLRSTPETKVIIEGHCDERGTSAYNLVLGERRANSVKRYLQELGIGASRIQVISYGKERPFCSEHTEDCWQSNRRAHFRKP